MAITALKIITDCAKQLQDDTNVTWSQNELLEWLNMGRRQIALAKPDVFVANASIVLAAGTRQQIPADGNVFIKLTRNMGADGNTPGRVILPIPMNVLDEQNPGWHMATPSAVALHYAFDERDPHRFYVYPPQPATPAQVEIVYSTTPTDIGINDGIGISDLYEGSLFNFVLSMAYGKDSEYTRNDAKSAEYLKRAGDLLAGMVAAQGKTDAANNRIGNARAGK